MLALSILLYGLEGESWLLFVVLFLVPDLSMLGYLGGPRIGAVSYNLFYTHAPPGMLAAFGLLAGSSLLLVGGPCVVFSYRVRSDGGLRA
jgi:hypothetical protein